MRALLKVVEDGAAFRTPGEPSDTDLIKLTFSDPRFVLERAGVRRRVAQMKAIEKEDLVAMSPGVGGAGRSPYPTSPWSFG